MFLILAVFCSLNAKAETNAPAVSILAEQVESVGFAPPDFRGVYRFTVLTDGTIQSTDNKEKTTVLGSLSADVVKGLSDVIDKIKSDELVVPTASGCMDAPSLSMQVRQSNGTQYTIWKNQACRDFNPKDDYAGAVEQTVSQLKNAFDRLK